MVVVVVVVGQGRPSWAVLGPCWAHVGPSWSHLGPMLGRLEPSWSHVGPIFSRLRAILGLGSLYVGPSRGHLGPSLGRREPSWRRDGPMLGHLRAILGLGWPYVAAAYVENIFRNNVWDFFRPAKQKLWKNPHFLTSPRCNSAPPKGPKPCKKRCFLNTTRKIHCKLHV